jgi:hypothetical protein
MAGAGGGTVESTTTYGSLAGVQAKLASLVTFSATSKPYTSADIVAALAAESTIIDMRLAAVGYETPVTALSAKAVLDESANLLVAATVYEAVAIGRDPASLNQAKLWRDRVGEVLDAACSGTASLPGAARAGNASASVPSVTASAVAFPSANTDAFVSAHGTGFSGA